VVQIRRQVEVVVQRLAETEARVEHDVFTGSTGLQAR
jgi:hypothetical protein